MDQFKGIFPATITPMLPDGGLNEEAYRKVLEFNIDAGAHGFWLAGGTGESVLLEDDENRRIAELAVDVCRGKAVTIQHVGAVTTRRAAALAEHAASAGSDAICCVPTFSIHAAMRRSSSIIAPSPPPRTCRSSVTIFRSARASRSRKIS